MTSMLFKKSTLLLIMALCFTSPSFGRNEGARVNFFIGMLSQAVPPFTWAAGVMYLSAPDRTFTENLAFNSGFSAMVALQIATIYLIYKGVDTVITEHRKQSKKSTCTAPGQAAVTQSVNHPASHSLR